MTIHPRYDKEHGLSYGLYKCTECGNSFFGGGKPLHKMSCSHYSNPSWDTGEYYYIFGEKENKGIGQQTYLLNSHAEYLKKVAPHLLEKWKAEG